MQNFHGKASVVLLFMMSLSRGNACLVPDDVAPSFQVKYVDTHVQKESYRGQIDHGQSMVQFAASISLIIHSTRTGCHTDQSGSGTIMCLACRAIMSVHMLCNLTRNNSTTILVLPYCKSSRTIYLIAHNFSYKNAINCKFCSNYRVNDYCIRLPWTSITNL